MSQQGDSLAVVRVRTKATLAQAPIAQLVMRGARACGFLSGGAVLADLMLEVGDPRIGCFVGTVKDEPRAVVVGFLPFSAFWLAPNIALAYHERAPRALVRLIGARLREWFRDNGHDHVHTANLMHTDRSYIHGLRHFGHASKAGSVIEFRFG